MSLPKLFLTDIDGVWTDGGMYYDEKGNELKKFNTSDSAGILFCKTLNIKTGIITGEQTEIVKRRAAKLDVDYLFLGAKNKVQIVKSIIEEMGISMQEVAYIGDDLNDIYLLKEVGYSATPSNAPSYVKEVAKYHIPVAGGQGAFRCFVETILEENKLLKSTIKKVLNNLNYVQ